ncbi:MAG: hypothetical protein PHU70_04305, partial [Dehalococcoidia bacterium]|nr:hypothetical protein [Dehalococcoidia bacterium]
VYAVHNASMKIVDDSASYVEGALRDFSGRDRIRLCFRARVAQNNATARIGLFDTGGAHGLMTLRFNNAGNITAHNNLSLTTLQAYSADTWYKFEILHDAASHLWSCCIDDVLKADGWNTYNNYTYQAVQHRCEFQTAAETGALYIDGWFVANWTTNEPAWSSFGAEESEAPPPPPAYHVILSAVYSEEAPGVNRTFVVGTDAAGGQVSGSTVTQADVDLVGERMDAHHNPAVSTTAVAAAVAAAQLARARLDGRRAELVIPPHCGLELWDVLAVIDTVANQDTLYRVTGYQLEYDTVKGAYLHRLFLSAV